MKPNALSKLTTLQYYAHTADTGSMFSHQQQYCSCLLLNGSSTVVIAHTAVDSVICNKDFVSNRECLHFSPNDIIAVINIVDANRIDNDDLLLNFAVSQSPHLILMHPFLHRAPNVVVVWVEMWTIGLQNSR